MTQPEDGAPHRNVSGHHLMFHNVYYQSSTWQWMMWCRDQHVGATCWLFGKLKKWAILVTGIGSVIDGFILIKDKENGMDDLSNLLVARQMVQLNMDIGQKSCTWPTMMRSQGGEKGLFLLMMRIPSCDMRYLLACLWTSLKVKCPGLSGNVSDTSLGSQTVFLAIYSTCKCKLDCTRHHLLVSWIFGAQAKTSDICHVGSSQSGVFLLSKSEGSLTHTPQLGGR